MRAMRNIRANWVESVARTCVAFTSSNARMPAASAMIMHSQIRLQSGFKDEDVHGF